jgi:hypothetical protein
MACGCAKNRPKVQRNVTPANQVSSQNYTLRVNASPRPQVEQIPPGVSVQSVNPAIEGTIPSPAGLDAHRRRVEQLRREAIRKAFGKS